MLKLDRQDRQVRASRRRLLLPEAHWHLLAALSVVYLYLSAASLAQHLNQHFQPYRQSPASHHHEQQQHETMLAKQQQQQQQPSETVRSQQQPPEDSATAPNLRIIRGDAAAESSSSEPNNANQPDMSAEETDSASGEDSNYESGNSPSDGGDSSGSASSYAPDDSTEADASDSGGDSVVTPARSVPTSTAASTTSTMASRPLPTRFSDLDRRAAVSPFSSPPQLLPARIPHRLNYSMGPPAAISTVSSLPLHRTTQSGMIPASFAAAVAASQPVRLQQPEVASTSAAPPPFNVNMGADRMLIKPHLQHQQPHLAPSADEHELATESVRHELLSQSASTQQPSSSTTMVNQRRQDLLYPSRVDDSNLRLSMSAFASSLPPLTGASIEQQDAAQVSVPSICYTPVALLMVILVTTMVTVVVCFCTHALLRYLSRHQFDLIESSKQFDTKHGSGQVQGASGGCSQVFAASSGAPNATGVGGGAPDDKHSCWLGFFQATDNSCDGRPTSQRMRDETHGFAFDNPYFRDDAANQRYLRDRQHQFHHQQQQLQEQQVASARNSGLLSTSSHLQQQQQQPQNQNQQQQQQQQQQVGGEQLHFIEHHISNLHTRQVTSSVKELSILGSPTAPSPHQLAQVVDLTSEEQRSRVIADPREGDLVAVDITGHDIIGLGFDVCGNSHKGIFIKSVLARGPARESGCIEPGDRIKCLNISFENITLQDACEILNCGAPYKMRLLLEKRASDLPAGGATFDKPRRKQVPPSARFGQFGQQHLQRSALDGTAMSAQPTGTLSATRTYIRRLANLVTPGQSKQQQQLQQQQQRLSSSALANFGAVGDHQLLAESAGYLGSAAARRHLTAGSLAFLQETAHENPAFGTSDEEDADEEDSQTLTAAAASDPAARNVPQRRLTHSDSLGSNLRGRFSVESTETEGAEFARDHHQATQSSIDYDPNRNHRLHGPPVHSGQLEAGRRELDLRLTASNGGDSERPATNLVHRLPALGQRRQTLASSGPHLAAEQPVTQTNLEQTQSQPEIALRDSTQTCAESGRVERAEKNDFGAQSRANRSSPMITMISSTSTPTMNLLTSNAKTSVGETWRLATQEKGKLHEQQRKESIREEPGSDSSFGADSTSKLVPDKTGSGGVQVKPPILSANPNVTGKLPGRLADTYRRPS